MSSTTIISGLQLYYDLKDANPGISRQFVKQIEHIIHQLENDNATEIELLQVMKKLDELITKIIFEYNNVIKVEKALDDLKKYTPAELHNLVSI